MGVLDLAVLVRHGNLRQVASSGSSRCSNGPGRYSASQIQAAVIMATPPLPNATTMYRCRRS
jgi:hypothetical protein